MSSDKPATAKHYCDTPRCGLHEGARARRRRKRLEASFPPNRVIREGDRLPRIPLEETHREPIRFVLVLLLVVAFVVLLECLTRREVFQP